MTNGDGPDLGAGLDPEAVEKANFNTVRRGYEPEPVRSRLREAAKEIRRLGDLVVSLQERIAEIEATPPERLEAARAVEAVGDEAARVLQAAREGAQERLDRAEARSAEITAKARSAAAAILEQGREQGREVVVEARKVRERILSDLAYERHAHRVEVEQLRVVHDRLLEALSIFQKGLDGWMAELTQAGPQAKGAAERAGLRVAAEPELTVGEIEAEIRAGRVAGLPLDDEAAAGDEVPEAGEDQEPVAQPAGGAEVEPAEPAGAAESAELAELEELDELDEFDGLDETSEFEHSEYVEIVGYKGDPPESPGRAAVGLYDVEAEPDFEAEAGTDSEHVLESDIAAPATDEAPEPAPQTVASNADAIFARLRSITSQPATEPPPGPEGQLPDTETEESEGAESGEASGPDSLVGAARAVAVGGIARRLKRLVVDEQGELLDSIRRSGARALRTAVAADAGPYARAAVEPLQDFASDIDVSIDDIDLKGASAAIVSILVEPVRARLSEMMEETDDADELTRAVRSVYRESRSRRADAAAEAAFSAGWPETVS